MQDKPGRSLALGNLGLLAHDRGDLERAEHLYQASLALAQELVVKEHVQYLAGFYFTPDAMAVTPILKQANVPTITIVNSARWYNKLLVTIGPENNPTCCPVTTANSRQQEE